jgi:hypothetical protein
MSDAIVKKKKEAKELKEKALKEAQVLEYKKEKVRSEKKLDDEMKKNEKQVSKIKSLEKDINDKDDAMEQLKAGYKKTIKSLKQDITDKDDAMEQLKAECKKTKKDLTEAMKVMNKKDKLAKDLRKVVENLTAEKDKMKLEIDEKNDRISDFFKLKKIKSDKKSNDSSVKEKVRAEQ